MFGRAVSSAGEAAVDAGAGRRGGAVQRAEPVVDGTGEPRIGAHPQLERDVGDAEVVLVDQFAQSLQAFDLAGTVVSVTARRAQGGDEPGLLEIAQHPLRPSGRLGCLGDGQRLHRQESTMVVSDSLAHAKSAATRPWASFGGGCRLTSRWPEFFAFSGAVDNPELSDPTSKIDRMSSTVEVGRSAAGLAGAHAAVDAPLAVDLTGDTDTQLMDSLRELERLSRRLAAVGHALIAKASARSLPDSRGASSMAALLRQVLRLRPSEASARVRAAEAAGPRRALTAEPLEPLEPIFADVAAAQVAGVISPEHARVIVRAVEALPEAVQAVHGVEVERERVAYAATFDPQSLHKLALHIHTWLDPDGSLDDPKERDRTRDLTLRQRPDGSASVRGELTAECAERILGVFDALGGPAPEADGVKDRRTAGQRRHDALLDALTRLCLAGSLPAAGGIATTVIVMMSEQSFQTRQGLAETSHGALVPARESLRWAGADQRTLTVRVTSDGAVTGHSDTRRRYSENQRLAILARDRGCTLPACERPAAWSQIHHITPWADGGPTSIDAALICGHHHRTFEQTGWQCTTLDSRPAWIPPPHIDPERRPRRNQLHEKPLRL